ncbi:MAG: hypothetical protein PHH54_04105 [Candidatus Nanoarchaeia archaeon]|nr:hypothetical protein [Candidatus Nanoarchaeia archaeon]MDD5741143.1 hypothetical protein [Candidatus Nanoarchaeia archaeon]
MVDSFSKIHETELFKKYELEIKCPNCRSEEIVVSMKCNGLFFVSSCNKCGYRG